jgi:hypothetical protein
MAGVYDACLMFCGTVARWNLGEDPRVVLPAGNQKRHFGSAATGDGAIGPIALFGRNG